MLVTRNLDAASDLLALQRLAPARYPLLLESSAAGTAHGRWDILLAASGESLALLPDGTLQCEDGSRKPGDFLDALDARWRELQLPREEPRWPFRGGWALLLAYELAAQVEPVLQLAPAPGRVPVALALRCPGAVLRDRASGDCVAVAESAHAGMLDAIEADFAAADALPSLREWSPPSRVDEDPPQRFTDGVARILEYLAAGDVFQ